MKKLEAWTASTQPDDALALAVLAEAEAARDRGFGSGDAETAALRAFLDQTRHPDFLTRLPDTAARLRWLDVVLEIVTHTGFDLRDLFAQRLATDPQRILFRDPAAGPTAAWTYAQTDRKIRSYAAALRSLSPTPRVALITPNRIRGAMTDLACLVHGLFITPLAPDTEPENILWICERLGIDIVVTGGDRQAETIDLLRREEALDVTHLVLDEPPSGVEAQMLERLSQEISPDRVEEILSGLPRPGLDDPATAMFTSGSTGRPKGVFFTPGNLVSKRFSRAAALPAVGRDETLLCFLPLFHTFGRYLEMLGTIFWGGTYAFAGNPSKDTLFTRLPAVHPTGLISVPLRWTQILEAAEAAGGPGSESEALRRIVGPDLRWGLSAAGYLDPRVFRYFQRNGVDLCSGFGMTEATGGITMTPPGEYRDNSVGKPLPGIDIRLSSEGEMQIRGPYVGRYVDPEEAELPDGWLATGDIFVRHEDGHYEIIDRSPLRHPLEGKNSRGQTIAPRRVEMKFSDVPGIKRVFLVGDHLNYNVLLVVPDREEALLKELHDENILRDYLRSLVTAANRDLAHHERVVNFRIIDRDFSLEHDELTPKGSYKRKNILANFAETIEDLYRGDHIELSVDGIRLRVPRWIHRDLGVLESDLVGGDGHLSDQEHGLDLVVETAAEGRIRIGDLEYEHRGDVVDLGLLIRQPALWLGNPALTAFCPVKDGWDTPFGGFTPHLYLVEGNIRSDRDFMDTAPTLQNGRLLRLHSLCARSLLLEGDLARKSVDELDHALDLADHHTSEALRRRLEALARHPDEEQRCAAYRILLLDEPTPDYSQVQPKFLRSGLPFLNEASIRKIARGGMEGRRLQAFRKRLHSYRRQLEWPADATARTQFNLIFSLLEDFVRFDPSYYGAVRGELTSWCQFWEDEAIAEQAEQHVYALGEWFERRLDAEITHRGPAAWKNKLIFQEGLSEEEIDRLTEVFTGTTFLQQSVMLTAEGFFLDIREVPRDGIWVGRTSVRMDQSSYRVSINTQDGMHFDLLVVLWDKATVETARDRILSTIYWMVTLASHPTETPVLPRFGCFRPDQGVMSQAFVSNLNVWERIREHASDRSMQDDEVEHRNWRRLFVRAMSVVFRAWRQSGKRILPGMITPMNVFVPEPDFREGDRVLSMGGWRRYTGPLDLVRPMLRNFYKQTIVNYPWTEKHLDLTWICDACVEACGPQDASAFLADLAGHLKDQRLDGYRGRLANELSAYTRNLETRAFLSCALIGAIERYRNWLKQQTEASPTAKRQVIDEVYRLYGLHRRPQQDRFHLYRRTWFSEAPSAVRDAFDRLLDTMFHNPAVRPASMVELSDLQSVLRDEDDRAVFMHMVFPHSRVPETTRLLEIGELDHRQVIVDTVITDKRGMEYHVREPLEPAEYGRLYRHFVKSGYYKTISEKDRFFVVTDHNDDVVAGISWQDVGDDVAHLNGIVVAHTLLGRGISSVLIDDFCTRLANLGYAAVKTHFVLRPFFERHGFQVDKRWGGLVRMLNR